MSIFYYKMDNVWVVSFEYDNIAYSETFSLNMLMALYDIKLSIDDIDKSFINKKYELIQTDNNFVLRLFIKDRNIDILLME